ncbi:MAG: DNA-binding response OmpR family regulator, partial [Candidatus Omnitrophota bacterium]
MLSEKILVVDDNPRVIQSLKLGLEEYEIKDFNSGEAVLDYLRKPNLINLVMLDIMMPGIDGLTTLQEIKKINKDIAVIMMTGFSSKDVAIEALRLHADDYVEKPFN